MRRVTMLWHGEKPIGICVFGAPPKGLGPRQQFFGLSGKWSRVKLQALSKQVAILSRVVLDPAYRGCGLAAAFVRRSCETSEWPWIEALAELGHINPFFERAGFIRVGECAAARASHAGHSLLYGNDPDRTGRKRQLSPETFQKSRHARPVYYVFDNRRPK